MNLTREELLGVITDHTVHDPRPEMCPCGVVPAPCECVAVELPPLTDSLDDEPEAE